jgi:hypothetical protein
MPSSLKSTSWCEGEGISNCRCLKCIFLRLSNLPLELFTEIIILAKQSKVQYIVSALSVVPRLRSELVKSPAREYDISSQGDIFGTYIQYGAKTYITSICDQEIAGSRKIKSKDMACNYAIVWSDRVGVTKIEFIHTETRTPAPESTCNECKQKIRRNYLQMCHNTKTSPDIQSKREWVRAVAITREHLFVKSKVYNPDDSCLQF